MNQIILANIALDIFSIILSLIPIGYLLSSQRWRQKMNLCFLGICVSNILMIFGDLADWTLRRSLTAPLQFLLIILTMIYYGASAGLLYFFAGYMAEYLKMNGRIRKKYLTAVSAFCAVQAFFSLASPFTGWFFHVTDAGYERGSLFLVSQLIPLFCYFIFTGIVILYRKHLTHREVIFFLTYIFLPLIGSGAQTLLRGIAVVNVGVTFSLLLILVNIQFEHEMLLHRQEEALARQHMDLMLSQIQPHFLYNALGTIAYLCRHNASKAAQATQEFAGFLRGNMESLKNPSPIPFEKELNHVKNYLYLEQQRFGDRLNIVYDIEIVDFLIPSLTLQPLVENAVRHGILPKKEGGTVVIRTRSEENRAVIIIEDNGIGIKEAQKLPGLGEHLHIGIDTVRDRLKTMMHGNLEIKSNDSGTAVVLRIPR